MISYPKTVPTVGTTTPCVKRLSPAAVCFPSVGTPKNRWGFAQPEKLKTKKTVVAGGARLNKPWADCQYLVLRY